MTEKKYERQRKRQTNLYLDLDLVLLARTKLLDSTGDDNLSELVNELLGEFVGAEEIHNPIRQQVRTLMEKKRKEYLSQKKIITDQEAVEIEVREYQEKRAAAIERACTSVFLKYRDFRRCLPEHDVDFLHIDEFNRAVADISHLAGYDVDSREVIAMYHQKTGTRAVQSRETMESVYGVKGEIRT